MPERELSERFGRKASYSLESAICLEAEPKRKRKLSQFTTRLARTLSTGAIYAACVGSTALKLLVGVFVAVKIEPRDVHREVDRRATHRPAAA